MSVNAPSQQPLISLVIPAAVENDQYIQDFFTTHEATYQKLDFASPFLALMEEAAKTTKRSKDKKEWVLQIHNGVIQRAYPDVDSLIQKIAHESASSLYDQLFDFYNETAFHYFYRYNYDSSEEHNPKIPQNNKDHVASSLKRDFSDQLLKELNGTSFFAHVFSIPDDLLWQEYLDELRPELLDLAFDKIFEEYEEAELRNAYKSLAPHFFAAFQTAQEKRVHLRKPRPINNSLCNCIIF